MQANISTAADPALEFMSENALKKALKQTEKDMYKAAKNMEFLEAARLRDLMDEIKGRLEKV
jgi:excinuclease ABC subunit B